MTEEEAARFPDVRLFRSSLSDEPFIFGLPLVNDRCVYLGPDDRCTVYEKRPARCRRFSCLGCYHVKGERHGFFLESRPDVVKLIELHLPDFVEQKTAESQPLL